MSKKRQQERKKKARQDRLRREKHLRQAQPAPFVHEIARYTDNDFEPGEQLPRQLPPMLLNERYMRDLQAAISEKGIETEAELQKFVAEYTAKQPALKAERHPHNAREEAQDLAYEAMETGDPDRAQQLARQALALDPDCVDALLVLAPLEASSPKELVTFLEKAVAAGERALGEDFFAKNTGHFWGLLETRPYMRARANLAGMLEGLGRIADAIGHYEAMLELNPNDNQGVRDSLLDCYLLTGNCEGARRLFEKYPEGFLAVFAWSKVLERFLSGALEEAEQARREAVANNRFVEAYLTGQKPLPRRLPGMFSPGQETEAMHCAATIGDAWRRHPQAVEWLKALSKSKPGRLSKR